MQIPSEWEESYGKEERPRRWAVLGEPISSLDPPLPICVEPDTSVKAAVSLMKERRIGAVLVTYGGRLVGIFTERDVLTKLVGVPLDAERTPVSELMTADPETLVQDDAIAFALKLMHEGGFRHVPLLDGQGRPVGIISIKDVVEFVAHLFSRELLTTPPAPSHLTPGAKEGA